MNPTETQRLSEQAIERLTKSRRLLAHSRACPAMHDGSCACGAQEAADDLGVLARQLAEAKGENAEYERLANTMLDALLIIRENEHGESYSAGVAMSCIASLDERRKVWYGAKTSVPAFLPKWLGGVADRISGPGAALNPPDPPAPPPKDPEAAADVEGAA